MLRWSGDGHISRDRASLIAGVDEDVHLLTNEEWTVVVLDPVDDLQYARVHAFSAVMGSSSGGRELTDRQDDTEREDSVHQDLKDGAAFFFRAD